jgi:PKD repeat protein
VKRWVARAWLMRGVAATALLIPLFVWLSGCWLYNVPPTAGFTISAQSGQVPLTINFSTVPSTDEDGVIAMFEWDFGDGTSGAGKSVSHTYNAAGTFVVMLRVTDDRGDSATARKTIYVLPGEPPGPTASFAASPSSGTSPLRVTFNASASTYENGTISWYEWDFGDGAIGYGRTVSHMFFSTGSQTYTITLTVRGSDGKTGTASGTITVQGPGGGTAPSGAPSARFVIDFPDTNNEVAPLRVDLDPGDSKADDGRTIATYTWSLGDGAAEATISPNVITHVYDTDEPSEVFSITLVVIDDVGATDSITKTVRAENYLPVAGFEIADDLDYANAGAVAAWWTGDEDTDGNDDRITYNNVTEAAHTVWIRSQEIVDADWLDKDNGDPTPTTENGEPDEFDDDNGNNMCFDPEGQTWEDDPAGGDPIDPPAWFPNRAWGIKRIEINWGDGNSDLVDFEDAADTTAEHDYDFAAGGVQSWTITVTAIDYLGAETSFSRTITFNEGGGP